MVSGEQIVQAGVRSDGELSKHGMKDCVSGRRNEIYRDQIRQDGRHRNLRAEKSWRKTRANERKKHVVIVLGLRQCSLLA